MWSWMWWRPWAKSQDVEAGPSTSVEEIGVVRLRFPAEMWTTQGRGDNGIVADINATRFDRTESDVAYHGLELLTGRFGKLRVIIKDLFFF